MMEISEMLQDHALLTGFVELLADTDTNVVKRTSRVAASIYYRAMPQMMVRILDENVVEQAWPIVLKLTHGLMNLIKTSENDGVILCLVHFVQEAVSAHLSNDVSAYPVVAQAGRDTVKNGLRVLKELVSLPHVGGMVFVTAMRSLVSLACLRPDLYEPVTSLVRKQVNNTPATLFDHNVRSLHKMLQRNLMKLLRISTDVQHKTALIELMVVVGVPRRYMAPWAPPGVSMKRQSPNDNERHTPPPKMQRTEIIPTERVAPPPPPPQKKPLSGFDLLTSLIPKSTFNMDEAEMTIASRLNLKNVCDLIIFNVERVPDDMPADFAKKFLNESVVGEIEPMKKRLSSLLTQVFTREQLKSLIDSKVAPKSSTPPKASTPPQIRPVSPPKANTPPLPSKDVDMRVFPTANFRAQPQPLPGLGSRDYDARIDPAAISSSRDPRNRQDTQSRDPRRRSPPNHNPSDPRQQRGPPQNVEMSRDPRSAQKPVPMPTNVTHPSLLGEYKHHSQPLYSTGQWAAANGGPNGSILGPYNQIMR